MRVISFARSSAYEPFEAPFQLYAVPRVYELHARNYSKDDHGQRAAGAASARGWCRLVVSYDTRSMDLNMDGVGTRQSGAWLPSSPQSKFAPAMVARRIAGLSETAAVDDDAATRNMLKG